MPNYSTNYGIQKSSASSVLEWYQDQDEIGWRIFMGRTPKPAQFHAGYTGNDKEEGFGRLVEALEKIEPTDYGYYCIQLISKSKAKDAMAPMCNFQIHQPPAPTYGGYGSYNSMNEILSEIRALKAERMKKSVDESDEEDEEPEEVGSVEPAAPSIQAVLAGVLAHPQITNLIVTAITNLAGNLMKPASAPVTAVAGVETDTIEQSIQILLSKGVTPDDLAKLAAMEQGQINFLLSMLRK